MKSRWILPALFAALTAAVLSVTLEVRSEPQSSAYQGDTVHSFVLFKIKHLGVSWVYGRFNDFKVSFETSADKPELSSVGFDVSADSVDTGNTERDKHLKSPDFLNASEYPRITFQSTSVKPLDKDTAEVTGDLTLHGVKKTITIKAAKVGSGKNMKGADLMGVETGFMIKRSDFGIKTMIGPVGDEVTLTVAVEGTRK